MLGVGIITIFVLSFLLDAAAAPELVENTSTTFGEAETRQTGTAASVETQGGNITEMNITQVSQTQYWQGIWGQIDFEMRLEDASGNVFYNWTTADVSSGEVFFTNNSVFYWNANLTNVSNSNVSWLQTEYNWANTTGPDNLTQTYVDGITHPAFNISLTGGGTLEINATSTPAVSLEAGTFYCAMLWHEMWSLPLWTSIINPDQTGFNGQTADFEALLPVRGALGTETYYAYVELE